MPIFIPKILLSIYLLGIVVFAFAPGNWTPAWVVNHDKFSHLMVFFFLSFMLKFSFPKMKPVLLLALLVFFAVLIELFQHSFFNRGFSSVDILYDLIGIGLFFIFVTGFQVLNLKQVLSLRQLND